MPYTGPDDPSLPQNVQGLPSRKRSQWVSIWNETYSACLDDGGSANDCETEAFRIANGVLKGAETKTVNGQSLTRDKFAYVPDPDHPSTWKLPIHDAAHVSAAAAALSPGGHRGERVQIPSKDRAAVVSRIRAAWRKFYPGKSDDEMPASLKSREADWDLSQRMRAQENQGPPPDWIPVLPIPGSYTHPLWDKVEFSQERNQRFIDHFKNRVYQDRLPLDAEHNLELGGAFGWIEDLRLNEDGSVDAKIDWTPRGERAWKEDRYRYVSPTFYDTWQDPMTEQWFEDVLVGAALTTRPFFKPSALRSIVADEFGHVFVAQRENADLVLLHEMKEYRMPDKTPEERLTELQGQHDAMVKQFEELGGIDAVLQRYQAFAELGDLDEIKQALEAAKQDPPENDPPEDDETLSKALSEVASLKKLTDDLGKQLEVERGARQAVELALRTERLTALTEEWNGDRDEHVAFMLKLSEQFGEDSDELKYYRSVQDANAEQTAQLFTQIGDDGDHVVDVSDKITAAARKLQEADPTMTMEKAISLAVQADPNLYTEYLRQQES